MHRYARLTVMSRLYFSLGIMTLVPAVPRESLHPAHALSTPTTVRPVIRLPTDLSRKQLPLPVLVAITQNHDASSKGSLSLIFWMPTCPGSCPGLLTQRSPPRLFYRSSLGWFETRT